VSLLESSIIRLCEKYGVNAFRTKDTGVWCRRPEGEKKIASIGIHIRRNITSHGVGINVSNEVLPFFDEIDACGLGKGVTTLQEMGIEIPREDVETKWVEELAIGLKREVLKLRDIGQLAEICGLEKGQIVDIIIRSERKRGENREQQ
jgi:lipoyl(octanoyl) transferase 2